MMKWVKYIGIFVGTFVIGTAAVLVARPNGLNNCVVDLEAGDNDGARANAPSPTGITVMYAGLVQSINGTFMLKVIIHNGLGIEISYPARSPHFPVPRLTVNGRKLPRPKERGNRVQIYDIPPGRSAEVYVYPQEFLERPRGSDRITVGFYATAEESSEDVPVVSAPFLLPDEFRKGIRGVRSYDRRP